jgi:DNA integrity scanning protein DisA with diadenylate cyclase activity
MKFSCRRWPCNNHHEHLENPSKLWRQLSYKGDTQSITDLEVAHRYFRSLEGTPTLHAQVLQRVFAEFGDSYTLLDVYNTQGKAFRVPHSEET